MGPGAGGLAVGPGAGGLAVGPGAGGLAVGPGAGGLAVGPGAGGLAGGGSRLGGHRHCLRHHSLDLLVGYVRAPVLHLLADSV